MHIRKCVRVGDGRRELADLVLHVHDLNHEQVNGLVGDHNTSHSIRANVSQLISELRDDFCAHRRLANLSQELTVGHITSLAESLQERDDDDE